MTQPVARLKIPKGKKQSLSHARAPRQERQAAHRLGADLVRRSGAGPVKGDVRKKRVFRLECKTTMAKSFSVTREMVEKIENAALGAGEVPAILIEFLGPDGKPQGEVAVVPSWVMDSLSSKKS